MFGNSNSNNNGNNQRMKSVVEDVAVWGIVGVIVIFGGKEFFKKYKEHLKQEVQSNVTINPEEMPRDTLFISEAVFNSANGHIENGAYDGFELKKHGRNGVDSVLVEVSRDVEYEPTSGIVRIEKGRRVVHPDDKEVSRSQKISAKYAPVAPEDKGKNMELISIQTEERGPVIKQNKIEEDVKESAPVRYTAEGRSGGDKVEKKIKKRLVAKHKILFNYQVINNNRQQDY